MGKKMRNENQSSGPIIFQKRPKTKEITSNIFCFQKEEQLIKAKTVISHRLSNQTFFPHPHREGKKLFSFFFKQKRKQKQFPSPLHSSLFFPSLPYINYISSSFPSYILFHSSSFFSPKRIRSFHFRFPTRVS